MTDEISEMVLEAFAELKEINNSVFHSYHCRAKEVQKDYKERIEPILEPFLDIRVVAEAMKERERIYAEQKREKGIY